MRVYGRNNGWRRERTGRVEKRGWSRRRDPCYLHCTPLFQAIRPTLLIFGRRARERIDRSINRCWNAWDSWNTCIIFGLKMESLESRNFAKKRIKDREDSLDGVFFIYDYRTPLSRQHSQSTMTTLVIDVVHMFNFHLKDVSMERRSIN